MNLKVKKDFVKNGFRKKDRYKIDLLFFQFNFENKSLFKLLLKIPILILIFLLDLILLIYVNLSKVDKIFILGVLTFLILKGLNLI